MLEHSIEILEFGLVLKSGYLCGSGGSLWWPLLFDFKNPIYPTPFDEAHVCELVKRLHQVWLKYQVLATRDSPKHHLKVLRRQLSKMADVRFWTKSHDENLP